jgi:hypothetical protein
MAPSWDDDAPPVSLADAATLAEGLRQARLATGRTLEELADTTRVKRQYLEALEEGAYDRLPSRPFSTGYVRAYARALGLDEETAAERFKAESPDGSVPLRPPVGSEIEDVKPRHTLWIATAAVMIAGVVGWNVVRHAMLAPKHSPSDIASNPPQYWRVGSTPGEVHIGAPLPAPADQTVPKPYITPGLEDKLAPQGGATVQNASFSNAPTTPVGAAFNPQGAIYGSDPGESNVTIQARKPALVVLRTADNVVYFAHQLAAGEAYRAPRSGGNLVLDVSDPAAFSVYLNGEFHGGLTQTVTPLSQLNSTAASLAGAAAAQAQRTAAAAQAAAQQATPQAPTGI